MTPIDIVLLIILTISLLSAILMGLLMIIKLVASDLTEIKENEDEISKVDNNE